MCFFLTRWFYGRAIRLKMAKNHCLWTCQKVYETRVCLKQQLRDYMPNIWGNADIAIMGAGQGVWPKLFFLVHVTMSTGPLASPPPRGGVSWSLPIFAPFLPVFPLVVISCWGMLETCASVSGHHFSHIKSHFNDFKQNLEIWGYLQKRHFTKMSVASKGARKN